MWQWDQSAGELTRNGTFISRGYSGKGRGKNNPSLENVAGVGPVPTGLWEIKAPYNSRNVGPYALPIYAVDATPNNDIHDKTGRSAFRIHGDKISAPGTASRGCIILPRNCREKIWKSGDHQLLVVE